MSDPLGRIALTGVANCGKDEVAKALYPLGYEKASFGDIVKARCRDMSAKDAAQIAVFAGDENPLEFDLPAQIIAAFCALRRGEIAPYTEVDAEKSVMRPLWEQAGLFWYDDILAEFMGNLPPVAVNTRLMRLKEAAAWTDGGGVLWEIVRPGAKAETDYAASQMAALHGSGLIAMTIQNAGGVFALHDRIRSEVGERPHECLLYDSLQFLADNQPELDKKAAGAWNFVASAQRRFAEAFPGETLTPAALSGFPGDIMLKWERGERREWLLMEFDDDGEPFGFSYLCLYDTVDGENAQWGEADFWGKFLPCARLVNAALPDSV